MGQKVSIIVPFYNSEKTLARCIDSIIKQTYQNIEIILINDGSNDSSNVIASIYKKNYSEIIKYYIIENKGVSYGRNFGIEISKGEFISFIDSDDFVEDNFVENLVGKMDSKTDLVCCGFNRYRGNDNHICIKKNLEENDPKNLDATTTYVWDKLFKRSIITKNNITFPEDVSFGEDYYFLTVYKLYCKNMTSVDQCLYNYMDISGGSITNSFDDTILDVVKVNKKVCEYYIEKKCFDKYSNELLKCSVGFYARRLREFRKYNNYDLKTKFVVEYLAYFKTYFPGWKKTVNYYKSTKSHFYRTNKLLLKFYIVATDLYAIMRKSKT